MNFRGFDLTAHNLNDISRAIFNLENKYSLLDLETKGVKVWQVARFDLFQNLARLAGVMDQAQTTRTSIRDHILNTPKILNSIICHNPFLDGSKVDTIVLDHERKMHVEGEWIDIYSHWFLDEIQERGELFAVLENRHIDRHITSPQKNRFHTDIFFIIARFFEKVSFVKLDSAVVETLQTVEIDVLRDFGVELYLIPFIQQQFREFIVHRFLWRKYLARKRPCRVVVVFAYGCMPLIAAAKSLGIATVEIQHGRITESHIGYSYPVNYSGETYFPDQLWVWGDMWKDAAAFPIQKEQVRVVGFHYAEEQRRKVAHLKKKSRQLTIFSQGAIGKQLSEIILDASPNLQEFDIVYKLHPGEYKRWRNYPALLELAQLPNIEVVDDDRYSLYKILAESTYVVGVYSTVIFEALDMECELLIVNLPGAEEVQSILSRADRLVWFSDFVDKQAELRDEK